MATATLLLFCAHMVFGALQSQPVFPETQSQLSVPPEQDDRVAPKQQSRLSAKSVTMAAGRRIQDMLGSNMHFRF